MQDITTDQGQTIAVRLSRVARSHATAVALRGHGLDAMSYEELDRRSNRFARFLHSRGVKRGDFVALLTGRSIATVVAIVGILKAGAAYLPLDQDDPPERLARVLAESAPSLVLTGRSQAAVSDRPAVDLDQALASSVEYPADAVACEAESDDPACVMYTSGSTGQPKGVVVPHRAVLRLVTQQTYAPFGSEETFLHLAPLAFDASTFEIWGALLNGGSVAVVDADKPSLDQIADAIAEHGVTVAWFTAGLFALLVDHRLDGLTPLRCILAGGDVLSPAHVRRAYAGLPDCLIVNGYGPTENTTFTCCYAIPRAGWGEAGIPIGPPIRATRVHVLDDQFRPVPEGERGQICCAGEGLATRYLHRPELTAEKFVEAEIPGVGRQRLYLTGDLGRRRPDGVVEFFGRFDHQVKIRGKRVEIGEIEEALRADSDVLDAVVVARDAIPDGKRLTAYLTLRADRIREQGAEKRVLGRLRGKLPDYMVPADVMALDHFPLTENGKVDRARLPAVERARPVMRRAAGGPSALETKVAALWEATLQCSPVDRDANFFDLGGTSLLLMALHAELRKAVDPQLPLMALFQHTSIRALVAHIETSEVARPVAAGLARQTLHRSALGASNGAA